MDDLRLQAVAARVVAWHNRHPLARRITAAQVKSVGYVGFGVPPAQAAMLGGEHAADTALAQAPLTSAPLATGAATGTATAAATGTPSAAAPMPTPVAAAAAALTSAAAAGPSEDDFAQAFAELAEMAAVEDQAAVSTATGSEPGSEPATAKPPAEDAAAPSSSAVEVEIDAPAAEAAPARDGALEIELDAAPASDEPLRAETPAVAEAAAETPVPNSAATPATPPPAATLAADSADLEVAVLDAPAGSQASASALPADGAQPGAGPSPISPAAPATPATPPGSSLRDRVLSRTFRGVATPGPDAPLHAASATGVQGALLATHDGYRPAAASAAAHHAAALAVAEPAHSENFMSPLSPRAVARWVTQQGRVLLQPPADGPVRLVGGSAFAASGASGPMYVMTVAVEGGSLRSRLLVGAGSPGQVLGTRLYSLPRVAVAAGLGVGLLLAVAVVATALLRPPAPQPVSHDEHAAPAAAAASAAASAPEAAASAATPADAASAPEAAVSVSAASAAAHGDTVPAHGNTHDVAPSSAAPAAATATATATAAAPHGDAHAALPTHTPPAATVAAAAPAQPELKITTERPLTAYAQRGRLDLPQRGSVLSDEDKAAVRQSVADARAAVGRAAPGRATAGGAVGASAHATPTSNSAAGQTAAPSHVAPSATAAAVPTGPVFAVSTRPLRTRAEAEQVQAAMNALLRTTGAAAVKSELLPEGEDWRVVAWPFGTQSQANDARALLVSRGMRVQVVGF